MKKINNIYKSGIIIEKLKLKWQPFSLKSLKEKTSQRDGLEFKNKFKYFQK